MYTLLPSFILGFHGCDEAVVEAVFAGGQHLQPSKNSYDCLAEAMKQAGIPLPVNKRIGLRNELLLRNLDCAVINAIHTTREDEGLPEFDSVRAAFIEGKELYPGAGFFDHNHIQVCVRNPRCVKGYFRPLPDPDHADAA